MNTFLQLLNALPAIVQSVQTVETAIPMSQSGQHKLNIVLGAAAAAWEAGQAAQQISKGDAVAAVQSITDLTVATLNAVGVFKHSTPVSSN
ncbi:MAG TPA: hypothetical protein VHZ74_02180 [Bryobacteraceae bacterium]|jgi:hypothetical protein|nr:hypothetical protein [Bryobacteraceae bacterium]